MQPAALAQRGVLGSKAAPAAASVLASLHRSLGATHLLLQWSPQQQLQQQRLSTVAAAAGGAKDAAAVADAGAASSNGNGESRVIETELRLEAERSYLSYAMSVIVGRALPDVRDGLKPVHRRILYAMHELGLAHNKPFRKCARVVGEVLGKFHPHGDTAVYDALVRLAQDFSMRAPLIDGHGNFGSLDDDPPAAMRYTECRLRPLASAALLADLEADTVDFQPNFDASVEEPSVLPARVPHLLINGSAGIAVGIATKIPPHNMGEVVAGLKALIRDPGISVAQLMQHIPAPDFPTGGEILMSPSVRDAYATGRGGILVRARLHIEDGGGGGRRGGKKGGASGGGGGGPNARQLVVATELPYQTNKAALVEQIARLVDAGTITGVSDVRDESDRDGMRVVVEVKRGSSAELVQNQLLKHTSVQARFSCNMVALVGATPRTLDLKAFLQHFLDFRCEVVERRGRFELDKVRKRLHLVDGYLVAMGALDGVVEAIRRAPDAGAASEALQREFGLSREQAEGVLGLTLRRLTSLEAGKLQEEQAALQARIADLTDLLQRRDRITAVVEAEAEEVAARFGTPRRTAIVTGADTELRTEDVIPNTPSLVVYSRRGYIKRMRAEAFAVQRLRGRGKAGARLKDNDSLDDVVLVHDHDHLLFLTQDGRAHTVRAYDVPEASRTATGTAIAQVLPIDRSTSVAAMLPVPQAQFAQEDLCLAMLSRNGQIKRTPLQNFASVSSRGVLAMKLLPGDRLEFAALCRPTDSLLITASNGMTLHFRADKLRPQSRLGGGVKAMKLDPSSHFVGLSVLPQGAALEDTAEGSASPDEQAAAEEGGASPEEEEPAAAGADEPSLLLVTAKGLGKRVPVSEFKLKGRIGQGVTAVRLNEGDRVAAAAVVGVAPPGRAPAYGGGGGDEGGASSGDEEGGGAGGAAQRQQDVLISTLQGLIIRLPVSKVSVRSRITKGQCLLKPQGGDEAATLTLVAAERGGG